MKLRVEDRIPDTVLFLEHEPVITRGKGLQFTGEDRPRQMPLGVIPSGISVCDSERGGDLTYHGPGQWVVYPICKLDGQGFAPRQDVVGFLRQLEGLLVAELADRGLSAFTRENATGVWVKAPDVTQTKDNKVQQPQNNKTDNKTAKKIASIGIAVRKWVTYHGIALNCVNDLSPFFFISPCGFQPEVMTRLQDWVALGPDWRAQLEHSWVRRMGGSEGRVFSVEYEEMAERVEIGWL